MILQSNTRKIKKLLCLVLGITPNGVAVRQDKDKRSVVYVVIAGEFKGKQRKGIRAIMASHGYDFVRLRKRLMDGIYYTCDLCVNTASFLEP
jgi:hypothetical protein